METKLPAIQAEQVEDDVAPVMAEYVPAKARDEECEKKLCVNQGRVSKARDYLILIVIS